MTPINKEYHNALLKLSLAANRGSAAFRTMIQHMWEHGEGPFKVCSGTDVCYGQAFYHRPDSCVYGCLIQVKASHTRPTQMMCAFSAPTQQLTFRIANDPLIPDDLDAITPDNWEPIISRMMDYQVEMDNTIRRRQ